MAEAVGLVASIIAIVDLSAKLASHCKFYIENAKDARADFRKLLIEITFVNAAINNLQFLIDHDPEFESDQLSSLSGDSGPVAGCRDALSRLENLLPHPDDAGSGDPNRTFKKKMNDIATRLAWPLKKTRAMDVLKELTQHKTNILLVMLGGISKDVKEIKVAVRDVQQRLTNIDKYRVLEWLTEINPSTLHHIAVKSYEEGTGNWVLRDMNWIAWIDPEAEQPRCLWLNGIPGAGKTVLASHLFSCIKKTHRARQPIQSPLQASSTTPETEAAQTTDRIQQLRQSSLPIAHIYYYCHNAHKCDEALPLLRWVISQLCRQSDLVPQGLVEIHGSGHQPSISQLMDMLETLLQSFHKVYLVVDALDESMPRARLLSLVHELSRDFRFRRLKLLATSRTYGDIALEMNLCSRSINMSNPLVQEDIRLFTVNDLKRRHATDFEHFEQEFMDYAADLISSKAEGMFRWAVLQIDALRRQRFKEISVLRNALQTMPKDLDDAYTKIFGLIVENSDDEGRCVRDALSWICNHTNLHHTSDMSINVLIQAIYPETRNPETSATQYALKKNDLHDGLGCLVRFRQASPTEVCDDADWWEGPFEETHPDWISLAHYTVSEFLASDRIQGTVAKYFIPLEPRAFYHSVLQSSLQDPFSLTSCPWPPHHQSLTAYQIWSSFALLDFKNRSELSHELWVAALQFFRPDRSHFDGAQQLMRALRYDDDMPDVVYSQAMKLQAATSYSNWRLISVARTIMALLENGFHDVVWAMLRGLGPSGCEELFTEPIRWESGYCFYDFEHRESTRDGFSFQFHGTLPQWAATLPAFEGWCDENFHCGSDWSVFPALCQRFASDFARKSPGLLLNVVASHQEMKGRWCNHRTGASSSCILTQLIGEGADPQPTDFGITPLQIAVSQDDVFATLALLEENADCNGYGTIGGHLFGSREPLSRFNSLHGMTPLYIHQNLIIRPMQTARQMLEDYGQHVKSRRLGQLLRERGGRAERVSQPGGVASCEVDYEIRPRDSEMRSDDEVSICELDSETDDESESNDTGESEDKMEVAN